MGENARRGLGRQSPVVLNGQEGNGPRRQIRKSRETSNHRLGFDATGWGAREPHKKREMGIPAYGGLAGEPAPSRLPGEPGTEQIRHPGRRAARQVPSSLRGPEENYCIVVTIEVILRHEL